MDAKSERDRTDLISLKKEAQTLTGNFSDGTSIYLQIAEMLENDILRGVLEEEGQAPDEIQDVKNAHARSFPAVSRYLSRKCLSYFPFIPPW